MGEWKERKYISWKRREADIRLRINFDSFIHSSLEEQQRLMNAIIVESLKTVQARCEAKKVRFDLDALLQDVFPNNQV